MSECRDTPTRLIGKQGNDFANQNLVQLKVDDVSWKVLWENPQTGEFWKEYFPQSEVHGGGPPEFLKISEQQARQEFGSW
jgi:hypothetical protein